MDGGRHLAGGAGEPAVGHHGHLVAVVHQHGERGDQFMEFRHARGLRPLKAHHGDEVAVQPALVEGRDELFLGVKDHGGGLDDRVGPVGQGGHLDDGAAQVAGDDLEPARERKKAAAPRRSPRGRPSAPAPPASVRRPSSSTGLRA